VTVDSSLPVTVDSMRAKYRTMLLKLHFSDISTFDSSNFQISENLKGIEISPWLIFLVIH
jgi:hypothetical protein